MKLILLLSLLSLMLAATVRAEEAAANPRVVLETSKGTIEIELDAAKAPATVENFLGYVESGFYSGTIFHRVIDGFMIQGGGFTEAMEKKATREPIQNEADNGLKNVKGTIAMARTNDPHSATAQFFINTVDNPYLDHRSKDVQGWGYTAFGRVVDGMDVVNAIAKSRTGNQMGMSDVPLEPIVIESVKVKQ